jgi:hypothetical protein
MAQDNQNTDPKTFDKGLNKDFNDFHLPPNQWSRARNAINNSITGDLGKLGNEPANLYCVSAPYPIIGFIHIIEDKWAVFSTDNTNSEIGLFIESNCGSKSTETCGPDIPYQKIVNDKCLNFKLDNLIKGSNINGVTKLIINKIDVLEKINYYCLIYLGEEIFFDKKLEFKNFIHQTLIEKCPLIQEVIFSYTPYEI